MIDASEAVATGRFRALRRASYCDRDILFLDNWTDLTDALQKLERLVRKAP